MTILPGFIYICFFAFNVIENLIQVDAAIFSPAPNGELSKGCQRSKKNGKSLFEYIFVIQFSFMILI